MKLINNVQKERRGMVGSWQSPRNVRARRLAGSAMELFGRNGTLILYSKGRRIAIGRPLRQAKSISPAESLHEENTAIIIRKIAPFVFFSFFRGRKPFREAGPTGVSISFYPFYSRAVARIVAT
jgi:hypothetical protein